MNQLAAVLYIATASAFFPPWQKLEAHQLLNPPHEETKTDSYGFPKYPKQEALPESCAIYELDKVVGYRLTC